VGATLKGGVRKNNERKVGQTMKKKIGGMLLALALGAAVLLAAQGETPGTDAASSHFEARLAAQCLETKPGCPKNWFKGLPREVQEEARARVRTDQLAALQSGEATEPDNSKASHVPGIVARLTGWGPGVVALLACCYLLLGWYRRRFGRPVEIVMSGGPLLREGARAEERKEP
jgi:hypothetical protein